jgi:hypothetical protein
MFLVKEKEEEAVEKKFNSKYIHVYMYTYIKYGYGILKRGRQERLTHSCTDNSEEEMNLYAEERLLFNLVFHCCLSRSHYNWV